ncbi:hypothetical protein [Sphaerisporangium aureirubrum]|uniref:Uncharacterized protein n=1 Tax=Sphaerisporangium aureirubrum TaxID=1544736 RepID=A0ABW1NND9_9ACTN
MSSGADAYTEGLDWLVFTWQQDGGLALRRSSLPAEEWEPWGRQLFTLVEVQRDSGAPSRPSICRLTVGGEPVALHRDPTADPDPRARIRTYAYKGVGPLLGPRQVLGVADTWHTRLSGTAETGPPLAPGALLTLTDDIRGALTARVRGAEPGEPSGGLSPLAAGLPRLVAEVLKKPEALFSCQARPDADPRVIMWGLMDLLDRVVGTADEGYWTFSTEQSDDFAAGLPRFVFLGQWPYSAKQSRHNRFDLTKDTVFAGDEHDEAAARLVEAYLHDPSEVAELCRAAGLKERDKDHSQIARLLKYFRSRRHAAHGTPRDFAPRQETETPWPSEETFPVPDEPSAAGAGPSAGTRAGQEAAGADPYGVVGVTKAYRHRAGRSPIQRPPFAPVGPSEDARPNLLESPEPDPPPREERHGPVPDPLGAGQTFAMTILVNSLRYAKTGEEIRSYLRDFPDSANADPENRAVLRAALDRYNCFNDLFQKLLPEDDVDVALEQVARCAFYDEDVADGDAFEESARLAGRPDTPSVVVSRLMELAVYNAQTRTREWMDIAVEEGRRPPKRNRGRFFGAAPETVPAAGAPPVAADADEPSKRPAARPVRARPHRGPRVPGFLSLERSVFVVLVLLVLLALFAMIWFVSAYGGGTPQEGAGVLPVPLGLSADAVGINSEIARSAV